MKIYLIKYEDSQITCRALQAEETEKQIKFPKTNQRISKKRLNKVEPGISIYTDDKQFGLNAVVDEIDRQRCEMNRRSSEMLNAVLKGIVEV